MHATSKDRAEYLARALGSGGAPAWMSQDEARAVEDMDPMGGAAAKLPVLPTQTPAKPQKEEANNEPSQDVIEVG